MLWLRSKKVARGPQVLGLAAVAWMAVGTDGRAADGQSGQPAPLTEKVVEPAFGRAASPAPVELPEDLQVRYAMVRLKLAELDLERAVRANRAATGTIGDRELDRLQSHIRVMEKRLEIARARPRTAARQAIVAAAEAACGDARGDLEAAMRSNERTPGSVSRLNLERLQAKLELAEIRLKLCRNPEYELSLLDEMQWNIDQLTDEVIDLRHQVETAGSQDFGRPD